MNMPFSQMPPMSLRHTFALDAATVALMRELAATHATSMAEIVRRGIRALAEQKPEPDRLAELAKLRAIARTIPKAHVEARLVAHAQQRAEMREEIDTRASKLRPLP